MDSVRRWMTSPAIVVSETTLLPEARRSMHDQRVRRLPVVDAAGALVGIITEGDINSVSDTPKTDVRDYNMYFDIAHLPVREIMRHKVIVVTPDTPLTEVAQLLLQHRIGGLPVVEHGQVVGVISESDLLRKLLDSQAALDGADADPRATQVGG